MSTGPVMARAAVQALRPSQIREVANAGLGLPDVVAELEKRHASRTSSAPARG